MTDPTWAKLKTRLKTVAILSTALLIILLPSQPTLSTLLLDLKISGVSLVALVIILEYIAYIMLKSRYGETGGKTLKLGTNLLISSFKETIIFFSRFYLLLAIVYLPLMGIALFTTLYLASATYVLSSNAPLSFWALMFGSLLANVLIIHYFLGRYGTVYKLPLILLVRKHIRLSSIECMSSLGILLVGSLAYFVVIYVLLTAFINVPSLLKIGVGATIVLLVTYVLHNRKYKTATDLLKKTTGCDKFS